MKKRKPPRNATPEDLLRCYRDTGDAGALFDAEAPGLFRVALGIAPDAAAAEDAVQETFLAAIDAAGTCDLSRPVRPWLVAILKNKITDGRRRAARVPDPLRLEPRLEPRSPSSDAERREMIETVRKEIEGLAEPYRIVALLRWQYGLTPGEIAHLRNEAPGTVRSTLSRALDRLRKTLKAVTPILLVLGVRPRSGLAAVRRTVLAEASLGAGAGASGGILIGGALVSYGSAALVLLATFVAGVVVSLGVQALAETGPVEPTVLETRRSDVGGRSSAPLAVVQHWAVPPRSNTSLEDRIGELLDRLNGEWHNAFPVGNLLVAFDEDVVLDVLRDRWESIESLEDRRQIIKAFAYQRHPRATDVIHLGMADREPLIRVRVAYHLLGISGRDFREDLGAYSLWRETTRGSSLPEILDRTNRALVAMLDHASTDRVKAMVEILRSHAWKVRYQRPAARRLLDALEPWLRTAGPGLLRDLLAVADEVDPSEAYLRRNVLDRIPAEPEIAPVVYEELAQWEYGWAKEDLLSRLRDPYEPALHEVAVALGALGDFTVVPEMLDALRLAPTMEAREAIEEGLGELTEYQTDDWQDWWMRNEKHLRTGETGR